MDQALVAKGGVHKCRSLGLIVILTVASIMLWDVPSVAWLLAPVKIFVTALHELGHAVACLATGGSVSGLTIVSDNSGHGGLTMCRGGNPFVYDQTGYLGTAFFGCLFILIGRFPLVAKTMLFLIGLGIGTASLILMPADLVQPGSILQGIGSIAWGLTIAAALIWCGLKLRPALAQFLLLFLAVQTALNALTDVWLLIQLSLGLYPVSTFSDATNMAEMTHIPAFIWSLLWGLVSLLMLAGTLWLSYRPGRRRATPI